MLQEIPSLRDAGTAYTTTTGYVATTDPYRNQMIGEEIPRRGDRIYNVGIQQVDRGYLVTVGCKTLVFENADALVINLSAYLKNPAEVQKKFEAGELFR